MLEKLRDLSAIGIITVGAIAAFVWAAGALATTSLQAPKLLIETLAALYNVAKEGADGYGAVLGALSLLAAALTLYMTARHARRRVAEMWMAKANAVRAQLIANPAAVHTDDPRLQPLVSNLVNLAHALRANESAPAEEQLSYDALLELRQDMSAAVSHLAIEIAANELDFGSAVATATPEERSGQPTLRERLTRVLASQRFCKDIGLFRKPLSYVVLSLFIVSLLGWTAEPMASSLRLTVNNLRINVVSRDATRDLDTALSSVAEKEANNAPSNPLPPAALQTTTRALAQAAARELVRSRILERIAGVERAATSEAEFVRAAIAQHRIEPPSTADHVAKLRYEVADHVSKNADDALGTARLEERVREVVRPHVERVHRDNPRLFARMGAALEARYATPMAPLDAQGQLIARMIDEALGGVDARPSTEIGKQGQRLVKEFGKESIKTWIDAYARAFTTDVVSAAARVDVVKRARVEFRFESTRDAQQFAYDLHAAEGSRWRSTGTAFEEARMHRVVAAKVAESAGSGRGVQLDLAERLSGYDHLFPSSGGVGDVVGNGTHASRASTHHATPARSFAQTRATNFRVASKSFRVRGVLLGQDHTSEGLDLADIRWSIAAGIAEQSTQVEVEIRQGSSWTSLGRFDAAVVNQALRYAADRRVVATTIGPGDGKVIRRVTNLHPVLADTPLGCRIVEADRFVDTFSFPSGHRSSPSRVAQLAADRTQMIQWIDAMQLAESVASLPGYEACPLPQVERAAQARQLQRTSFSPALSKALQEFLEKEEQRNPGSTRFLQNAHGCMTDSSSSIATCLCARVRPAGLGGQYWFPEDHTSQFREKPASLGRDLAWMRRSADHLAHVDLWVHTTFALRKPGADGQVDEATATTVEFPPEQLRALRIHVGESLPRYLASSLRSPTYGHFMAPLEDFLLLQRFMRAALASGLGRDFPVTKLIQLERETRRFVPYQPTIRWEAARGDLPLAKFLAQADPKAEAVYMAWDADARERRTSLKPMCDRVSR